MCACCINNECGCGGTDLVREGTMLASEHIDCLGVRGLRTVMIAIELPDTNSAEQAAAMARVVLDTQSPMPVAVIEPELTTVPDAPPIKTAEPTPVTELVLVTWPPCSSSIP